MQKAARFAKLLLNLRFAGDDERKNILSAAYRQYLLNQVTDAVKTDAEMYMEYNKPWE